MKKELRQQVYAKFDGHCAYCGQSMEYKDMQVDHFVPQWLEEEQMNSFDNLMPSCRTCNHYKRGHSIEGFRRLMKTLHERVSSIYIVKVAIQFGTVKIEKFSGKFYFENYNK